MSPTSRNFTESAAADVEREAHHARLSSDVYLVAVLDGEDVTTARTRASNAHTARVRTYQDTKRISQDAQVDGSPPRIVALAAVANVQTLFAAPNAAHSAQILLSGCRTSSRRIWACLLSLGVRNCELAPRRDPRIQSLCELAWSGQTLLGRVRRTLLSRWRTIFAVRAHVPLR
jgi:hypothetical protein